VKNQAHRADVGNVRRAGKSLLLLLGLLILLSGCITINLNSGPRPAEDKANGTRQQNSGDDQEEDCDEQIRSAARLAAYPKPMARPSMAVAQPQPGDQWDNCLEDDTDLPRKRFKTNQPAGQARPARGAPISVWAPVGSAHGRRGTRTLSRSAVICYDQYRLERCS
jgi:hypothetical protein